MERDGARVGSPAPTPAPHTPVVFLLAGGMANFSSACAKLLMNAGYDPAAFGSHAYVQSLTERAKQRVAHYNSLKSESNPNADDFRPPESDFRLAECEPIPLASDPNRPLNGLQSTSSPADVHWVKNADPLPARQTPGGGSQTMVPRNQHSGLNPVS